MKSTNKTKTFYCQLVNLTREYQTSAKSSKKRWGITQENDIRLIILKATPSVFHKEGTKKNERRSKNLKGIFANAKLIEVSFTKDSANFSVRKCNTKECNCCKI